MKTTIINVEQGSPEWHAQRLGRPTASKFDKVVTPAKGELSAQSRTYKAQLVDQRVRPDFWIEKEKNDWKSDSMAVGVELEPQARKYFELSRGVKLEQVGSVLREDGVLCSPDSLFVDEDGVEAGLEIKCPDGATHVVWSDEEILPIEHKPQVHGGMAVSGRRRWYFMSYCPGYLPFVVRVDWSAYTDAVNAAITKFAVDVDALHAKITGGL